MGLPSCMLIFLCLAAVGIASSSSSDFVQSECLKVSAQDFTSSVKFAMEAVRQVSDVFSQFTNIFGDFRASNAVSDCLDLLDMSVDELSWSVSNTSSNGKRNSTGNRIFDMRSWLSAALSNQATCMDGFEGTNSIVKSVVGGGLNQVSSLVLELLSMVRPQDPPPNGSTKGGSGGGSTGRRLMKYPSWVPLRDRRLIAQGGASSGASGANVVVALDGSGKYKTITEAILAAPDYSSNRYVIYVKKGIYKENVEIKKKKWNLMLIGDGMGQTIISSNRNFIDGWTTFRSATFGKNYLALSLSIRGFACFVQSTYIKLCTLVKDGIHIIKYSNVIMGSDQAVAIQVVSGKILTDSFAIAAVSGKGFMAQDITFENTAGPEKHQAVALRSDSDLSVYYRCEIKGYQDTLYTHTLRQFFRECRISGTVDFIFGDGTVVFQNCQILAKKGLSNQKNTITAQGRKDPSQPTGFSIQFCNITADSDLLQSSDNSTATYLGRPWKQYSRTVIMQSYISNVIKPQGWLEWSGNFALDTLYYGEYMNFGPGAGLGSRVNWPGYHALNNSSQANAFTVAEFIKGDLWLPLRGVRYTSGLMV